MLIDPRTSSIDLEQSRWIVSEVACAERRRKSQCVGWIEILINNKP